MPEWKFPIDLPRFTDEEFQRKKAEYIAEHGYEVHLPSISEIIKLGTPEEPTDEEFQTWKTIYKEEKRKEWYQKKGLKYPGPKYPLPYMAPRRYSEITGMVEEKRRRYKRMLASPVPTWMNNVASVMTFFDDINDTLGTLGVLCRAAAWLLPRFAKRFLLGPAGWLFLGADVFGLVLHLMSLPFKAIGIPFSCSGYKKSLESFGEINPFSKKARVSRARKLRRWRPSKGEIIEGLQTTNQVFGYGLCLGPIMGAAYDIIFGVYRTVTGEKVQWFSEPQRPYGHEVVALRFIREAAAVASAGQEITDEEFLRLTIAYDLAMKVLKPYIKQNNPLDHVGDVGDIMIPAPRPHHPTTLFVLEENGIKEGERVGWPHLDKEYATYEEMWEMYQPKIARNMMDYCVRNRTNPVGLVAALNAQEGGIAAMANTEGINPIDMEWTAELYGFQKWIAAGCPDFHWYEYWTFREYGDPKTFMACDCLWHQFSARKGFITSTYVQGSVGAPPEHYYKYSRPWCEDACGWPKIWGDCPVGLPLGPEETDPTTDPQTLGYKRTSYIVPADLRGLLKTP